MIMINSRIPGFHKMDVDQRLNTLVDLNIITKRERKILKDNGSCLSSGVADKMSENVIGVFGLPLSIATNFLVNKRDYIVPMVTEEPSVVAGVSNAAKITRLSGGFQVKIAESLLIGQIQLMDVKDPEVVIKQLEQEKKKLIEFANSLQPRLVLRGGGTKDIEFFKYLLEDSNKWMVILHLLVDTQEAMGANLVNTLCELIAPKIESICDHKVSLKILSNLADRSLVTAKTSIPLEHLEIKDFSGKEVGMGIVNATKFANIDPYRAATHNKGIMNGIDAVAIATGNDWRSMEAAAHAYAVKNGRYQSLTNWNIDTDNSLTGQLTVPIKVGIVGGSLQANPAAALGLKICNVKSSHELSEIIGAVGLAQNFAALRALSTHGIQKGHMSLHARSVAASLNIPQKYFDDVVREMINEGEVKSWKAKEILNNLKSSTKFRDSKKGKSFKDEVTGNADGKVILLGEHAAVYGKHVLAIPIPKAVQSTIREINSETKVIICDPSRSMEIDTKDKNKSVDPMINLIMKKLKINDRSFSIKINSKIPMGAGLGSSAAFAVAIIRAFNNFLNLSMDNKSVNQIAYECEKLSHGSPSGVDNNMATYGIPMLYSKNNLKPVKSIDLDKLLPLIIAVSSHRSSTKEQILGVKLRFDQSPVLYEKIFCQIDELSKSGSEALIKGDYKTLGMLMNICHGLLNAIEVSSPEIEDMIDTARSHGAIGAKLTGAGGGGAIIALCPDQKEKVISEFVNAGYYVLDLQKIILDKNA